jgi:hypothetical protein
MPARRSRLICSAADTSRQIDQFWYTLYQNWSKSNLHSRRTSFGKAFQ